MISKLREEVEEFEERERKLYQTSVFLFKMLLAGTVFQAILFLYPETYGLQAGLAQIVQALLNTGGIGFERQGFLLLDSKSSYLITQDCLGWKSMAVFTALMFSSTSRYRKHLKPFLIGLTAIFVANIVRIITTVYLSHSGIISYEIIHSIFWKWGLTAVTLSLWVLWLYKNSDANNLGNL